ncbi:autotransporter-associated beta strand repeat-containing protein [Mucilaginibacter gossypiicola]|uniref:Autotransporter-associated beta strand repeat-containing protein n=1 Tax=Mucilaginibacter gossypiicola TaxID=551995 RepID=A0A1H8S7B5_9SPHI|nr:cellulose binding domain-containing protein [Mucilaginibacter gossypiicola]SEO74427.1 autotransporter-associated beta strand repeat-containing protein [Mucilaginibacter gossypiicola]
MKKLFTLCNYLTGTHRRIRLLLFSLSIFVTMGVRAQTFVHPGLAFNQADLNQLKANISREPWLSGYNAFKNDSHSQLSYGQKGPFATVTRAPNLNNSAWIDDMQAVHNLAWMWWFTGDSTYARKATNLLDAWAVTNTTWGGGESMLDIGDYAQYWGVGAEILRSTFPGWTAANTQHVKNYFANVLFPTSWVPSPLRDANKGALQLKIALAASVFCDDATRFNQAVEVYRMDAGGGMRNSLPGGEVGDSGRDDHWRVQAAALAWGAEVAYKQGVDMFAELDNRVLAIGELYHKYAFDGATMTFIPLGGYASYWTSWGIQPGARAGDMTNLIYSAYNVRKGIPTPNTDRMRAALMQTGSANYAAAGGNFLYLKSSDTSTAVKLPQVYYPADHVQPVSNLTNVDIGNPGLAGSASYNNGIWTLQGAGTSTSNAFSFNFKKISGDAGLVVKVENMSLNSGGCGVMLRQSLAPGSAFYDIFLKATGGAGNHWQPKAPWWLKIERVGTRIFTYHSQDGISWTGLGCWYSATGFPTDLYAGFYTLSSNNSALNTATFSNVGYSQSAPAGSPEITSATTATATIGAAFSYNIIASANPSSYSASGLPSGLSLNAATGVISGTPTTLGQSEITISATNASGTGTATLMLNVVNNQTPAAPTSAAASVVNATQINLTWVASANATSYSVKRSLSSTGPFTTIQSGITTTSYIDASPVPEVNNYYVVTALAGTLESGNSNVIFSSVPPAAPSQPVAVSKNHEIDLSWNAATGAATYNVKRATISGGPYTTVANVSTTTYADVNVSNGSPYYYVVSALGQTKESANSAESFGVPGSSTSTWSQQPESGLLTLASNWQENATPVNPAIITFQTSADTVLTNDIANLVASRIQFNAGANNYSIGGAAIHLRNDLVNNSTAYQTLSMPVTLDTLLNVNTPGVNGTVALTGQITGTGSLLKNGIGFAYVGGNNTYSGGTTLNGNGQSWPPVYGMEISGTSTGAPSAPTSGPLGTGKITMNGGALFSVNADATLYNDIEIAAGKTSYFYQTSYALNLYGRLTGSGTIIQDGNVYAGLHLFADNSSFTGYFVSKLRSGNSRTRFEVPQSGSANASWNLDANGNDCQGIMFPTGTISFGSLSGRGAIRTDGGGNPTISIGALNISTNYGGTMTGTMNVEKVGTAVLIFSGNQAYSGTTTIKNGTYLLNNDPNSGTFTSPVIASAGTFGGAGQSSSTAIIGTGTGTGAALAPGNLAIGTLKVGSLTMNADATYKVELSTSSATSDKVSTSVVNLVNQPKLQITAIDSTSLAQGASFTIIDNTGSAAIAGTFKGLPELAPVTVGNFTLRISYKGGTGNDVVLLDDRPLPVIITSAPTDTTLIGKPMTYTVTGIKSPNHFSASGLPAGLQIDSLSGKISGTPTQSGTFNVSLTAGNGSTTATSTLALTVLGSAVNSLIVAAGDAKNILEWKSLPGYSYNVKRSATSGGPYTTLGSVNNLAFTDSNVSNGTTYFYVIAPADSTGEGAKSTEVVAKPNTGQRDFYQFDEASGTRGIDAWGANHAVLAATANRGTGKYGKSLLLDGSANAYATLPAGIFGTLNDFTISAWVRMDAISTWMRVFDFGSSTTQYMFLTVQAAVTNGQSTIRYATKNGSAAEQNINYNYTFPLNTWTYLAVTRAGNTTTLYINGTSVASSTNITIKPSALGSTTQNYLGKSQFADPMFKGSIDNFKIYGRALSSTEIAADVLGDQIITFASIDGKTFGDADFVPPATASSGLAVSYNSSDTTVASVISGAVHIKAAGTATITASQPGNSSFKAATPINQSLTVSKKAQTITFNAIPAKTVADSDFVAGATASSGLAISYSSSDSTVAQIAGGKLHIVGSGIAVITASQDGNASYLPAPAVTQTLTVNKLSQSISFAALPLSRPGDADVSLNASSTSGLPVVYTSSNQSVATIINNKLHIVGSGSSAITAQQGGNARFDTTALSKTFNVLPYNIQVQSSDGDNNQPANNVIKPFLKIVNQDSVAVNFNELTMRYWFTAENYSGINSWIDYAQMGNSNVTMKYVQLPDPHTGALGYIEYGFLTNGQLSAGSNSGVIQSRFANQDWSNFSETDDYSYLPYTGNYAANSHITLYRNGQLIYGTEPTAVAAAPAFTVSYQNQNQGTTGNAISTYLVLNNTGNVPVNYSDLSVRYWFSREGTAGLNFSVGYAKLGNSKIINRFATLSPALNGADTYLELTIDPSAGSLYPLSNTGNIQYQVNKTDWSAFNEANDYSYAAKAAMALNSHITVYYKDQLIYGTEPSLLSNNSLASNIGSKTGIVQDNNAPIGTVQNNVIYPNPVASRSFNIKLTPDLDQKDITLVIRDNFGKVMQSGKYRGFGGSLGVQLTRSYMTGVYFVQINNLAPLRMIVSP